MSDNGMEFLNETTYNADMDIDLIILGTREMRKLLKYMCRNDVCANDLIYSDLDNKPHMLTIEEIETTIKTLEIIGSYGEDKYTFVK